MGKNTTLNDVIRAQPKWFSAQNRAFFKDKEYSVHHSPSGHPYLVRSTYAWTDMFGGPRYLHWRINPINAVTLEIEDLTDDEFATEEDALAWVASASGRRVS